MLFSLRKKKQENLKSAMEKFVTPLFLAAIFAFGFIYQSAPTEATALPAAQPLPTPPQTSLERMLKEKAAKGKKTATVKETKKPVTTAKARPAKAAPPVQPKATVAVKTISKVKRFRPVRKVVTKTKPKVADDVIAGTDSRHSTVFMTGAGGVEILINGKSMGVTNNNAKLTLSLANGEYSLAARKRDRDLFPPIPIVITPEQKVFDFSAQIAKGLDELQKNVAEPENTTVETKTVDVNAILTAYRDPFETNKVTAKDWQIIYEQSQRKLAFGTKNNEVEGLSNFAQAQVELSLGNTVKAVNLFEAAAYLMPNSAMMHYGLGVSRLSTGIIPDAGTAFIKTLQLDPKFALAYKGLGDVYLMQDKPKEAAINYQQAQRLGMTTPELRLKLAEAQIKNKFCSGAIKELEVLRVEAPSAAVMIGLSDCYLEQKRAVSAIDALKEAVRLEPNVALSHYKLGAIYLKQKEYENAKQSLERALVLDADNKLDRKELREMINKAQKNSR